MKRRWTCPGCGTKVGTRDAAAVVITPHENGTQSETAICLPCIIRIARDDDYAKRFDAAAIAAMTGRIEA